MWPIHLIFPRFISCTILLSSLTLCNTSSFPTRSAQLIFFDLLQHHISKLPRCFWSTFRSVQVSAPYKSNYPNLAYYSTSNLSPGPGSSVSIATDYGLDCPRSNPGGDEIFRPSRPALGSTQSPVQWVPSLFRGRGGRGVGLTPTQSRVQRS